MRPENRIMLDFSDYFFAWCCYIVGALGLCVVFWRITRSIKQYIAGRLLRLLLVIFLFTPWVVEADKPFLAPAFLLVFFDVLAEGNAAAARAGKPMLLIAVIIIILFFCYELCKRLLQQYRLKQQQENIIDEL